ncbi:MAG: two-component sensor histidine kinase BarA, partial [Anaerolineales bacterium]|nr:two-component sensor histidine kinase BarA [Anaerolineales bacterium]
FSEDLDGNAARDYIATIRRNGLYLLEIINDILDLSKIEAGKFELFNESFSPVRLVEDVRSIMDVRAAEKNISLGVEYCGRVPGTVCIDQKRLKQILINLIGNAIKFTNQGTVTLSIAYAPASNQIGFRIADTGIGMTGFQMERLFQPFTQVDTSESRQYEGTGLGLAISRRIANMMGGEITVESEVGVGSCFTATVD